MAIYDIEDKKPKMSQKERDDMMKKFLEKGGKVQKLKPGSAAVLGSLDKSKKPAYTKEDIEKGVTGQSTPNSGKYTVLGAGYNLGGGVNIETAYITIEQKEGGTVDTDADMILTKLSFGF